MFGPACSLLLILHLLNIPLAAGHTNPLSLQFVFCLVYFGSGNDALASFPNNNINKGRQTHDKPDLFMEEYEKYGNNCMQVAKVLSTRTPTRIKKHAEYFF